MRVKCCGSQSVGAGIYFRYGTMIVYVFYLHKILRSMFILETIFCIDNINEVISLYLL